MTRSKRRSLMVGSFACYQGFLLYILSEKSDVWYNELIDKTVAELTIFDALRMLRQNVQPQLAILKTIQFLLEDVFAGDAYDGQALEALLKVDRTVWEPYKEILLRIVAEAFVQCQEREWSYDGEQDEVLDVIKQLCKQLGLEEFHFCE